MNHGLRQIISGGQTGVDRAALDVALELEFPCGGWCPRGRRAEDGPLDMRYPLRETTSFSYAERTRRNVRDTDGTLIITCGPPVGGTALTLHFARTMPRHRLVVDLQQKTAEQAAHGAFHWIRAARLETLNVAGPRASSAPEIYDAASALMRIVLIRLLASPMVNRPVTPAG